MHRMLWVQWTVLASLAEMIKYQLTREKWKSLGKGNENYYDIENAHWTVIWKDCLAQEEKV